MAEVIGNSVTAPTATLASGVNTSVTSLTVNGWDSPLPQTGTFRVLIDNELVEVGSVTGATLGSLVRGAESTTAASHNAGAEVNLVLTAGGLAAYVSQNGGSQPGAMIVRAFPFAYDTAGILTGAAVYTPTIGDILVDAWIAIDTAWDGTTPKGDLGVWPGIAGGFGIWKAYCGEPLDMTHADNSTYSNEFGPDQIAGGNLGPLSTMANISTPTGYEWGLYTVLATAVNLIATPTSSGARIIPLKFTGATPLQVLVSQDGTNSGEDPGSTQGAAVLYLVTATPA